LHFFTCAGISAEQKGHSIVCIVLRSLIS
jgi:hypothetical protein